MSFEISIDSSFAQQLADPKQPVIKKNLDKRIEKLRSSTLEHYTNDYNFLQGVLDECHSKNPLRAKMVTCLESLMTKIYVKEMAENLKGCSKEVREYFQVWKSVQNKPLSLQELKVNFFNSFNQDMLALFKEEKITEDMFKDRCHEVLFALKLQVKNEDYFNFCLDKFGESLKDYPKCVREFYLPWRSCQTTPLPYEELRNDFFNIFKDVYQHQFAEHRKTTLERLEGLYNGVIFKTNLDAIDDRYKTLVDGFEALKNLSITSAVDVKEMHKAVEAFNNTCKEYEFSVRYLECTILFESVVPEARTKLAKRLNSFVVEPERKERVEYEKWMTTCNITEETPNRATTTSNVSRDYDYDSDEEVEWFPPAMFLAAQARYLEAEARIEARERFYAEIQTQFRIKDNAGAGNCLFYSVLDGIKGLGPEIAKNYSGFAVSASDLRRLVYTYISVEYDTYKDTFLTYLNTEHNDEQPVENLKSTYTKNFKAIKDQDEFIAYLNARGIDDYLESMSISRGYPGLPEIMALAQMMKLNIVLHTNAFEGNSTYGGFPNAPTIHILRPEGERHFQCLLERVEGEEPALADGSDSSDEDDVDLGNVAWVVEDDDWVELNPTPAAPKKAPEHELHLVTKVLLAFARVLS